MFLKIKHLHLSWSSRVKKASELESWILSIVILSLTKNWNWIIFFFFSWWIFSKEFANLFIGRITSQDWIMLFDDPILISSLAILNFFLQIGNNEPIENLGEIMPPPWSVPDCSNFLILILFITTVPFKIGQSYVETNSSPWREIY